MELPNNNADIDKVSRYLAAKNLLKRKLLNGELGHGEQLLPELKLCEITNLSRTTIRKAFADLVEEGLLVRFRGRGTFVNIRRTSKQSKVLGLLVCQHSHTTSAYDLMIQGAEDTAARFGYKLLIANTRNDGEEAMEQVIRLNDERVAGTLVVPLQTEALEESTARVVRALTQAAQKVVMIDDFQEREDLPSVSSQNREAMFQLTEHIISLGYRRLAFLTSHRIEAVAEREEGFWNAISKHHLEIPPEHFLTVAKQDPTLQGIQEVDVFMAMRQPPEAIICVHDLIALNVLRRAKERGWRVPEDVSVVGFDDLPASKDSDPPLTTIHQPLYDIGVHGVEMLVASLREEPLPNTHLRLPCRLVVRSSCGSSKRSAVAPAQARE